MSLDTTITAGVPAGSTESRSGNSVQSPFCREIRSKRYYFLREMPTEESHLKDGSNHCWCRISMKAYGPDGELARPTDCVAGRACYRSLFEAE